MSYIQQIGGTTFASPGSPYEYTSAYTNNLPAGVIPTAATAAALAATYGQRQQQPAPGAPILAATGGPYVSQHAAAHEMLASSIIGGDYGGGVPGSFAGAARFIPVGSGQSMATVFTPASQTASRIYGPAWTKDLFNTAMRSQIPVETQAAIQRQLVQQSFGPFNQGVMAPYAVYTPPPSHVYAAAAPSSSVAAAAPAFATPAPITAAALTPQDAALASDGTSAYDTSSSSSSNYYSSSSSAPPSSSTWQGSSSSPATPNVSSYDPSVQGDALAAAGAADAMRAAYPTRVFHTFPHPHVVAPDELTIPAGVAPRWWPAGIPFRPAPAVWLPPQPVPLTAVGNVVLQEVVDEMHGRGVRGLDGMTRPGSVACAYNGGGPRSPLWYASPTPFGITPFDRRNYLHNAMLEM
jgi:hypothetical protein